MQAENWEEELTPSLKLEGKAWPAGLDSPDGAVIMLRKRHGGQITLSAGDWAALIEFCGTQDADAVRSAQAGAEDSAD